MIGWDFIRHHKLDFVWNDFGDLTIRDKRANISKILKYKSLPLSDSLKLKRISRVDAQLKRFPGVVGQDAEELKRVCPVGVFDIEDIGKKAIVKDSEACTTCRECIRHEKFEDREE